MVDLGLNQYKIEEIKYRVKENKIVTFKLHNFNLADVTVEEVDAPKEAIEEPDYHPFSTAEDYKKPVGEMKVEELTKAVKNKQYKIDKTIIDEHNAVEEKKISDNFNKLSKVDVERCKELINALDGIPYKIIEKIGELRTNGNGEGMFITEPDPYVVNDERELPKVAKGLEEMRKKYNDVPCQNKLSEDEKTTLEASKEKEWKNSMKNDIITNPIIVTVDLDKKYKDMSTGEKREISKKLIEKDAKEDSKIIKERVENSIGTNEPLSEELINAPEERSFKEKAWVNKRNLRLSDSNVPDEIKNVWKEDITQKSGNTEAYNSLKNSLENQWKLDAEKEKTSEANGE